MFEYIRQLAKAFWAQRGARLALLLLATMIPVVFLVGTSREEGRIGGIIGERGYDLVSWELRNFFDKWLNQARGLFAGGDSEGEKLAKVEEFFRLSRELGSLDGSIERAVARGEDQLPSLVRARGDLEKRRRGLRGDVEEIMEGQISKVLVEEGLSWKLPVLDADGYLFPPVDFRFDDSPRVLAISPRDRIELVETHLLNPALSLADIEGIEAGVEEDRALSALITGTSGVATYPSVVPQSSSIRDTLRTVAHEWVHHYMVFFPLGRNYWASSDMVTVNETVANVIGDEIGDRAFARFYQSRSIHEDRQESKDSLDFGGDDFDFDREMRATRLMVDELLAQGKMEDAERYMEERRLFFAENGFFLRRLNQAYFAFYGSYADRPSSVSPIGGQVKEIRSRSRSVKGFIGAVSGLSSYQELLGLIGEE